MDGITLLKRDITTITSDAIVNAANEHLRAGGGVCGAIFSAAGYEKLQVACNDIGHCETGNAVATPAFDLPASYIIHAVGPIWQGGTHDEAAKLARCYTQSLKRAQELGCKSIAFPLISSGIYGYPAEEAWEVALRSCKDWLLAHPDYEMHITFCVISDELLALGTQTLQALDCGSGILDKPCAIAPPSTALP